MTVEREAALGRPFALPSAAEPARIPFAGAVRGATGGRGGAATPDGSDDAELTGDAAATDDRRHRQPRNRRPSVRRPTTIGYLRRCVLFDTIAVVSAGVLAYFIRFDSPRDLVDGDGNTSSRSSS